MTLAVAILLFGFSSVSLVPGWAGAWTQSAQQTDGTQTSNVPSVPQQSSPQTNKPATTETSKVPAHKRSAKRPAKKATQKKVAGAGCDSSTTASPAKNGNTSLPDPSTTQTDGANPNVPKKCPPEKIVVRQGGTAEPAIQLAGGDQESQKLKEANQLLGSTDENLKKISSIQLSMEQQDTVSQIKQFVDESKKALAAGDLERGHTLAWKAQLLSDDLVKPQK